MVVILLITLLLILLILMICRGQESFKGGRKCVVCLTAWKTADKVADNFKNFKDLQKIFETFVVTYYVESTDTKTIEAIDQQSKNFNGEVNVIINNDQPLKYRTERIAKGRNANLDFIRRVHSDAEFFIVMDCDDVTPNSKFKYKVLSKYLDRTDWDALSFNSNSYYDAWALRYYPFINDCWNYGNNARLISWYLISDILKKIDNLKEGELLEVFSAFNGFAIYRTDKFLNSRYNGQRVSNFSKDDLDKNTEYIRRTYNIPSLKIQGSDWCGKESDCEHSSFHLDAIKRTGAKIRITKDKIFD